MRMTLSAGLVLTCIALTGCEEFSFTEMTPEEQAFLDLQDQTLSIRDELDGVTETPYADLPVSGSAAYVGTALINLDTPVTSELIGDASILVNFATDRVTGGMTGFHGMIDGGSVEAFDGSIVLSNGAIAARSSGYIDAQANGTLSSDSHDIDVGATLNGGLFGDTSSGLIPPSGIDLNTDADSDFALDGADVGGTLEVIGLTD